MEDGQSTGINNAQQPAQNSTPPYNSPKTKRSYKKLLVFLVLVIILAAVGAFLWPAKKTLSPTASQSPWADYSSQKYGFKFTYPKSWGNPQVREAVAGSGKHYLISFVSTSTKVGFDPKTKQLVLPNKSEWIEMDSADATSKSCTSETECEVIPGITESAVKTVLSKHDISLAQQDASSYAAVSAAPLYNQQSNLDVYQIVNLPKIKVSAAHGLFHISGKAAGCPQNKFSANISCVSRSDYNSLNKTLRSLKAL